MRRLGITLLALSFLGGAGRSAAQEHPNVQHGFAPEKAFKGGDLDRVNTFNGSLTLTIPLGPTYTVGGSLSYGLSLVYNSNPWKFSGRHSSTNGQDVTLAVPALLSNAGLGWSVSLGHVYSPTDPTNDSPLWVYVSPDGGSHNFYDNLHDGEATNPGIHYSRDGNYLRLKELSVGAEVDFPNGQVHTFDALGRLTKMADPFGNSLQVDYGQSLQWILREVPAGGSVTHPQRTHKVYFKVSGTADYPPMVDHVDMAAFNTVPSGSAVYQFGYSGPTKILRPFPNDDVPTAGGRPDFVTVPFLTSVTLPGDNSAYRMDGATDYKIEPPPPPVDPGNPSDPNNFSVPPNGTAASGSILGVTLPTLGRVEWTYRQYAFPTDSTKFPMRSQTIGIGTRTLRDASGTALGTWTYDTQITPTPPGNQELVNTLTDPQGNQTVRYFSVISRGSGPGPSQYGLPFSPLAPPDTAGRFLSIQSFQGSGSSRTLLRSTYVRYENDLTGTGMTALLDQTRLNQREASSSAVYHDDVVPDPTHGNSPSPVHTDVDRSDFDGLGHYRTEALGGLFPGVANSTSFTGYNLALFPPSTPIIPNPVGPVAPPAPSAVWRLDDVRQKITQMAIIEGNGVAETDLCLDRATGFVTRRRMLAGNGTARGAHDILNVFTPSGESAGSIGFEQDYGGDLQALPTDTDPCTMTLPANDQFGIVHHYQFGSLMSSSYTDVFHNPLPFKMLDLTIDQNTGLPSASRDTAQLQTIYNYDALGRITSSVPDTQQAGVGVSLGGQTTYAYTPARNAATLAQVSIQRRDSSGASLLAFSTILFDSLGRAWREQQKMADGSMSPPARRSTTRWAGRRRSPSWVERSARGRSTSPSTHSAVRPRSGRRTARRTTSS